MNVVDVLLIDGIVSELSKWLIFPSSIFGLCLTNKDLHRAYIHCMNSMTRKTGWKSYCKYFPRNQYELTFINGQKHGKYKLWWGGAKQQLRVETTYVDGKRHGKHCCWFSNGKLEIEMEFRNNKRHGAYHRYTKDLKSKYHEQGFYVNGKKHGVFVIWDHDGRLFQSTTYFYGKKHGYQFFYHNGGLYRKYKYKYDIIVEVAQFRWLENEDNNLKNEGKDRENVFYVAAAGFCLLMSGYFLLGSIVRELEKNNK